MSPRNQRLLHQLVALSLPVFVALAPARAADASPGEGSTRPAEKTSATIDTCQYNPSSCGYPDADNTGPRGESTIRWLRVPQERTSGPGWEWNDTYDSIVVFGEGAVLRHLDVSGAVIIDASDVTLKDSRITSCGGEQDADTVAVRFDSGNDAYRGANARIIHNTIRGTPPGCDHRARSGVRDVFGEAPNMLVAGNDIAGTGNGVTMEYEGLARNNWVHDLGHMAEDHHSGLSNHGGAKHVVFRHNTALLDGATYPGGGGLSGALTIYSDFGHAQNVTLRDNLISGGSYVIYGGNSGDDVTTKATGIKVIDNRFACGDWTYGPVGFFDLRAPGNVWRHNYCDRTGKRVGWHQIG
jgi:hypothetical protein